MSQRLLSCPARRWRSVKPCACVAAAWLLVGCAPLPPADDVAPRVGVAPPAVTGPAATVAPAASAGSVPTALARHRGWQDAEPLPWPAANAAVRQAGGWRAYAREAQAGAPLEGAALPPAVGTAPAPAPAPVTPAAAPPR